MDIRGMGIAAATLGLGILAVSPSALPAFAQAPGAAPRAVAVPRVGPPGRAGWNRPGRGFTGRGLAGRGFAGRSFGYGAGLAYGGLYPWGAYGGGAGAGAPTAIDASVRTYPSPDELAPAAWSYGTYGIPTVPGIVAPPKGEPVVYVIDGGRRAPRPGAKALSRERDEWVAVDPQPTAGGARVVSVRVPN